MDVVLSNGVAQSASFQGKATLNRRKRHTTATGAVGGISEAGSAHRQVCKKEIPETSVSDISFSGSPCWARTSDTVINSHVLCQLS